MKIVITGASGFLGRALLGKLQEDPDNKIFALTSCGEELRKIVGSSAKVLERNIIFEDAGIPVLQDAVVVHCAFPRNASGSEMATGMDYLLTLLQKAKKAGAQAVINISSQSIYASERSKPAEEGMAPSPETTYAVGKYASELLTDAVLSGSATAYTSIRLASLIGPGFDVRIVNRFVKAALIEHQIRLQDTEAEFGFMDIGDAVSGIGSILKSDRTTWKKRYNLGIKGTYHLRDIACTVREIIRKKDGIDVPVFSEPGNDSRNSALDATLFYRDFGFSPQVSLAESIEKIREDMIRRSMHERQS